MTLIQWSHGKSLLWDVTIRVTLAPSYMNEFSKKSGSIADKAETFKHNSYRRLAKINYLHLLLLNLYSVLTKDHFLGNVYNQTIVGLSP